MHDGPSLTCWNKVSALKEWPDLKVCFPPDEREDQNEMHVNHPTLPRWNVGVGVTLLETFPHTQEVLA